MEELGNVLTVLGNVTSIFGIVVTFGAYLSRKVPLRALEPGLVAWWGRRRAWVRRKLGRARTITMQFGTATEGVTFTGHATVFKWNPLQPDDDIETRVTKLNQNLEELRVNIDGMRKQEYERFRETTDGLSERITDLQQTVVKGNEETRQVETQAMRWELRGLLVALAGLVVSLVGSILVVLS